VFTPERLCSLYNCAFWGEGNDYQLYSDTDGLAEVTHCAVAEDQFRAPGTTPTDMVWLTAIPFTTPTSAFPLADGGLVDVGHDFGYVEDLVRRPVPTGLLPDIGCYEWYAAVGVAETVPAVATVEAWPNPFNPRTTVACRLDRAGWAALSIHDAAGRRVRQLHAGDLAAGLHQWIWDGLDQAGRPLASGVYLAVLRTGAGSGAVTKLTLVR
jgi:hypothetical protein